MATSALPGSLGQAAASAGSLDEAALTALFDKAMQVSGVTGAQMAVIRGGEFFEIAGGYANAERGIPMSTNTVMQIGSVTKVLNAMLVASLQEEGRLDFDEPVKEYIPYFALADTQAADSVTLRHLLSMSSGMDNGPYTNHGEDDGATERYVKSLQAVPHHFKPGRFYGYSNAGSVVAAHAAESVAAESWARLLRQRVLGPIGVSGVLFDSDISDGDISYGHQRGDAKKTVVVAPVMSPARARFASGAALAMTMGDLARVGEVFIRGGTAFNGKRVLAAESVAAMMRPQTDKPSRRYGRKWCLGPAFDQWQGVDVWGHPGGTETALTFLQWFPEKQGVLTFCLNTHAAAAAFAAVMFAEVLQHVFGFTQTPIDQPDAHVPSIEPERFVGTYGSLDFQATVTHTVDGLKADFSDHYQGNTTHSEMLLEPMGGDRFLLRSVGKPSGAVPSDTAFFGRDGEGRAQHMLRNVFPITRRKA